MKLDHWFKRLRVVIIGLFTIAMLAYMSVLSSAEQANNEITVSALDIQKARDLFFMNDNEVPTFWGNPVVPVFYDATGKHDKLLNKAEVFALYYAAASSTKTINDEGVNEEPTFAFVIADHKIETSQLAPPLKDILSEKWKDTPISGALNGKALRYLVNGTFDGTKCSLFISAMQKNNPSHYRLNSAVIIANNSMSEDDILLCFKNKTSLAFGIATSTFDFDRRFDLQLWDGLYFGLYPALLDTSSTCREIDVKNTLACVVDMLDKKYRYLLDSLLYK